MKQGPDMVKKPKTKGVERSQQASVALILAKHYSQQLRDPVLLSAEEAVHHSPHNSLQGGGCYT